MFFPRRNMSKIQTQSSTTSSDKVVDDKSSIDADPEVEDVDIEEVDVDDVDVDVEVTSKKLHFLDYDAVPPPDFEQHFDRALTLSHTGGAKYFDVAQVNLPTSITMGEQLKIDKKYEHDGEISDYELAASGYTKKEFTQDDNTLYLATGNVGGTGSGNGNGGSVTITTKHKIPFVQPKHFLDENPIPPDYMIEHELREHRSLDRNFERQNEQQQRNDSPNNLHGRKSSLDRGSSASTGMARTSRDRLKEPSYTLSRFLDSNSQMFVGSPAMAAMSLSQHQPLKSGNAWTDSYDSRYSSGMHFSSATTPGSSGDAEVLDRLEPKVECVYSLLSMLGSNDSPHEMAKKFFELSRSLETCISLRHAGCIPLLVQMIHSTENEENVKKISGMALHNIVHSHPDERAGRREAKVLRLLDQIIDYCSFLKTLLQSGGEAIADDSDRHPLAAISSLMKVSFDEEHRHAMCELGALKAIPNLVHLDHAVHGPRPEDQSCNSLRRYALMALTNLTFGDENNKALLCSQKLFMEALVAQLDSAPDDLLQVTASVLRNLSWRADTNMKAVLNEIGTVTALARAAMKNKSENTLKAILSALWNLSAHCSTNKAEFCAVDGALAFLVDMLTYEGPSKTLKIIENAGGILRNVSSHIAVREHYRQILRERNCLSILLQQLKSESLTVVSNSCGTLWNLSARCPEDQKFLWDNGAVPMLRSLIHSKHAMISEGSSSALKNLLNFRPTIQNQNQLDPIARSMGLKKLPTLNARKQKALEQELDAKKHEETCDNLDVTMSTSTSTSQQQCKERMNFEATSSIRRYPLTIIGGATIPSGITTTTLTTTTTTTRLSRSTMLTKSESRDSVFSAKSDSAYENLIRSHMTPDSSTRKKIATPFTAFELESDDVEATEEPIDYSVKYNENSSKIVENTPIKIVDENNEQTYQETDLDQPTDFSLRYAENQIESDIDISPPEVEVVVIDTNNSSGVVEMKPSQTDNGNEILLILEDSTKCYQTEGTPYVISNAASITDLRQQKVEPTNLGNSKSTVVSNSKKYQHQQQQQDTSQPITATYGPPGACTPEKPINYHEEGTPGYFSRYESLSSLDESPPLASLNSRKVVDTNNVEIVKSKNEVRKSTIDSVEESRITKTAITQTEQQEQIQLKQDVVQQSNNNINNMNSAQETPLMFSRRSSMDSLVEEDVGPCDDKSSVVSEFSRLASGIISPSEIPDSPTQSMPQSPRRNSGSGHINTYQNTGALSLTPRSCTNDELTTRPLRSVFEDNLNTFHVENTPAQFSCATSLSNLSIMDDENLSPQELQLQQPDNSGKTSSSDATASSIIENVILNKSNAISEEETDCTANNDEQLLANCINIGMNRTKEVPVFKSKSTRSNKVESIIATLPNDDHPKQYFTENTPAKIGSPTDLSVISIDSTNNELKDDTLFELPNAAYNSANRRSLNLSDDVSSNASESGVVSQSYEILQQCIRDGMKKPSSAASKLNKELPLAVPVAIKDPIAMMRRGGSALPPYLTVSDEVNKYLVEDSPCNFSVASGLSNLTTTDSSLVGPAVELMEKATSDNKNNNDLKMGQQLAANATVSRSTEMLSQLVQLKQKEDVCREQAWLDDSLSSLSIESEDETNLLSQAIAAGCNRPKSNLSFSSTAVTNKRLTSLSASQPIPINSATSASSLTSAATARTYQQKKKQHGKNNNVNDSYSSIESSDSNDNQSKSLFELCILTGMNKTKENTSRRSLYHHHHHSHHHQYHLSSRSKTDVTSTTKSNPNLKQFDSLPVQMPLLIKQYSSNRHVRERERTDEKLLLECINTGITKKVIGSGSGSENAKMTNESQLNVTTTRTIAGSKNVKATSVVALAQYPQMEDITSKTHVQNIITSALTAAPDVEKINDIITDITTITTSSSNNNNNNNNSSSSNNVKINSNVNIDRLDGIIKDQKNPLIATAVASVVDLEKPQNPVNIREITMNVTGSNNEADSEMSNSLSLENTTSDESNESFIIETTVSLDKNDECRQCPTIVTSQKHKDPDLMLKSVERLTLEFVSSADQIRTTKTIINDNSEISSCVNNKSRLGSISLGGVSSSTGGDGGSNSNNTWNDETYPNDVSFPSVSMTAPVVASLKNDEEIDNENDVANDICEDEQTTEADHKELYDFAEITPTNEDQPQPSLGYICDETDMYEVVTQPNSFDTETETFTLINDHRNSMMKPIDAIYDKKLNSNSNNNNSGINFKVGGEVQCAAAIPTAGPHNHLHNMYLKNSPMTNSTIIAFEARALSENLKQTADDDNSELTFSINSLDLDNIRPPSGMESLNMSGFYQDLSSNVMQSNSLPRGSFFSQSPHLSRKSPKFPRKSLPAGLVAKRALGQIDLTGSIESVNSSCNLLDNVKPPSLMDELLDSMISVDSIQSEIADYESLATTISLSNYETAAAGGIGEVNEMIEDNTVTLQSCYDSVLPHDDDKDLSINNGTTPLPSDNDFSSTDTTPQKSLNSSLNGVKRSLTPKQKRKDVKDRYKTYTIAANNALSEELQRKLALAQQDEMLKIEIVDNVTEAVTSQTTSPSRSSSAQRRRSSQERYKTQTIVYSTHLSQPNHSLEKVDSTEDLSEEDLSSIRAMTKQFKYISSPLLVNDAYSGQPQSLQECDYHNTIDYEQQNSETESCHEQQSHPYTGGDRKNETASPVKLRVEAEDAVTVNNEEKVMADVVVENERSHNELKNNKSDSVTASAATVRGRKKTTYVSPYSAQCKQRSGSSTITTTRLATNKVLPSKLVINAKHNNSSNQTRSNNGHGSATTTKLAQKKSTKKETEVTTLTISLERQGTFIKDEPTIVSTQVPIVATTSAESSPTKRSSKLPTKRLTTTTTIGAAATARKIQSTTNVTAIGKQTASSGGTFKMPPNTVRRIAAAGAIATVAGIPQRSNSNANIRVTSNARSTALSIRVSATTPPSRSNSNLNSVTAANAAKKAAAKITQAQSRIASIWKRGDEVKSKQHLKTTAPATNKIKCVKANAKTTTTTTTTTTITTTSTPSQQKLIRSSTFDNTPIPNSTLSPKVTTPTSSIPTLVVETKIIKKPATARGVSGLNLPTTNLATNSKIGVSKISINRSGPVVGGVSGYGDGVR